MRSAELSGVIMFGTESCPLIETSELKSAPLLTVMFEEATPLICVVSIVVDVVVVLFTLPVTSPVTPSIICVLSSANTEPVKLPEKSAPSTTIPVSAEPSSAGSAPVSAVASIVPLIPSINSELSSAKKEPVKLPDKSEPSTMIPVNAEPSSAGSAPVNADASIVPSVPSISSVLSSANTDPLRSPVTSPVTLPVTSPVKSNAAVVMLDSQLVPFHVYVVPLTTCVSLTLGLLGNCIAIIPLRF